MDKKRNVGIFLAVLILIVIAVFMLISLFSKPIYEVTFDTNGGSVIASVELKARETVNKPSSPVKDGFYFTGWYLGEELFDFNTEIVKDITLTAKWQEVGQAMVTVRFDTLEGSKVEDMIIPYGETLKSIPNPTKDDYVFVNWYYQNKVFDFSNPITEDITLVAKWKKDTSKKYMVSFNTDGGSEIESVTVKAGSTLTPPSTPIKNGYHFVGWYLENKEYDFTKPINENINLQAKWEKD